MKKIGKKLSYLTKVFLVLGMLFTNFSSFASVVYAYEGEDETVISENNDELVEEDNTNDEEKKIVEKENTDSELLEENNEEETKGETEEEKLAEENNVEAEEETSEKEVVEGEETLEEIPTEDETSEEVPVEGEITEGDGETIEPAEDETVVKHDYTKELNDSASLVHLDLFYLFFEGKVRVIEFISDEEVEDIVSNAFEDVTYELTDDKLILTDGDKTITYNIVIYDEEYVKELMKKAVGNGETVEDDDVNGDGKVDAYDVVLLKQMLNSGFDSELINQKVTIESKFDGDASNLKVGDTFTAQYVLTLSEYAVDGIKGLIKYNKDVLRLDKVEVRNFEVGEEQDGKFLYFGDALRGTKKVVTDEDGNELTTYEPEDYVVVVMTFTAIGSGNDTISIDDIGYFNEEVYYEGNTSDSLDVSVISSNNRLSSVTVAGQEITVDELTDVYSITVGNDVINVDLSYVLSDSNASISSIAAPEELAVGENTITITVMAQNGEERTYTITVVREEKTKEEVKEEVAEPINYQNTYNDYNDKNEENIVEEKQEDKKDNKQEEVKENKDESKLSKIIIIALILLAIAGLIYLIFKDEDDEETKKANKEVDKLKKEELKEVNSKKEVNNKKTKKKER